MRAEEEKQREFFSLIGEFIRKWQQLEHTLLAAHRDLYPQTSPKWMSASRIIVQWQRDGVISEEFAYRLRDLNRFRNALIHEHMNFPPGEVRERIAQIEDLLARIWTEIDMA